MNNSPLGNDVKVTSLTAAEIEALARQCGMGGDGFGWLSSQAALEKYTAEVIARCGYVPPTNNA